MKSVFSFFVFFIISVFLSATIINIPGDQPTIQQGIDVAVNSDTVLVSPGTYVENINFNGKNIMVASWFLTTQDTTYITQTIIDGNQNGSVVTFESGEDSTAVLCGFTIQNGMGIMVNEGGGIHCWSNSNPNLHNLIIKENFAHFGGGIYCYNSSPIIRNLTIINNGVPIVSGGGGGIFLYNNSNSIITNVRINGNFSYHYGGGVWCIGSNPILENVIISENIAAFGGGGILLTATTMTLSNVVINHNEVSGGLSPSDGGGIYSTNSVSVLTNVTIAENTTWGEYGGIYCTDNSNFTFLNCILWNDSAAEIYLEDSSIDVVYSDIQGGWEGEGNIDEDPLFVNPDEGNFHLQDTSPCIGAGIDEIEIGGTWYYAPLFDIEGNPRPDPVGSIPDMGAYENPLGEPQVGIEDCQLSIVDFQLHNYPNPFKPSGAGRSPATTIYFSVAQTSSFVTIEIYNIKGQLIKVLPCHTELVSKCEDFYSITWDGTNQNNQSVSSGIYFYSLKVDDKTIASRKCLL
ncbi:MAG: right-handed parallel beta-helix repeat-containing protein, partial [Candidatus Cloacimonetes bacterium]|nr:right-handed parallel beta-helix repeat-containing protein [Candidatus Cloacimonadota bacterium]